MEQNLSPAYVMITGNSAPPKPSAGVGSEGRKNETPQSKSKVSVLKNKFEQPETVEGPPPPYETAHLYPPTGPNTNHFVPQQQGSQHQSPQPFPPQNPGQTSHPCAPSNPMPYNPQHQPQYMWGSPPPTHGHPAQYMYGPPQGYRQPQNPQDGGWGPPQGNQPYNPQFGGWGPPQGYPMQWQHGNWGPPTQYPPPSAQQSMQLQGGNTDTQGQNPTSNTEQQFTSTQSHPLDDSTNIEQEISSKVDSSLHIHTQPSVKQRAQQHKKTEGPPVKGKKKGNRLSQTMLSQFESEPIMMCAQDPQTKPRLAERVIAQCTCDAKVKPLTYVLDMQPYKKKKNLDMIERFCFGKKPRKQVTERVLMVVGATGAGKSTLINGMINHVFGVRWEDKFRFKMIVEKPISQAHSVTQKITAYTIYYQEGSPINFTLTIIDTPGFGDTKGLERDKKIIGQVKDFFSMSPQDGGVDHLDAIGFVTQASLARLTPTQRYIFDSILSVFGRNVSGNIFMLITFADGSKPPVVDAIKEANIPYKKFFKFNNSAIYPRSEQSQQNTFDDSDDDEGGDFSHMFWDMGMKSFSNFFTRFKVIEPQSLQLTNEVLKERQQLEAVISGLQPRINEGLAKIEELNKERQILESHENDILTNKDFTYSVTLTKQRKVNLNTGHYVTNCLICNYTCHDDCVYNSDDDKWQCSVMDDGGLEGAKCTVCPGECHWTEHHNNPYRFDLYQEDEKRTQQDLKRKYAKAMAGKSQVEAMIGTMESRLSKLDQSVMGMIRQVRMSLERLDEIALKPNPLTEVEYIDLLIESEKQEARPGWQGRIKYYQATKTQAQITTGVKNMGTPQQGKEVQSTMWTSMQHWFMSD